MMYADYGYYTGTFFGTLPTAEYNKKATTASAHLDRATFGRIGAVTDTDILDRVKMACCEVVDVLKLNEDGGGIASETNDGVSVSYRNGVSNAKTDDQRILAAIKLHLGGTNLLYRGVG